MTETVAPALSQVRQLLAENGYEVSELGDDVLRVRDIETGVAFQAALNGSILFMSVTLTTLPDESIPTHMLRSMLAGDNGIATSAFRLYPAAENKTAVTLSNFCTLQNMGEEDADDILSLAGYLMADLLEARQLFEGAESGVAAS